MTITIATANLIDTLTDSLQTADSDGAGPGIHLATHRDGYGDEPGVLDLLAATSTDRFVIGHTWIPVDGQVVSHVWPVDSAKNVLVICKSLLATRGKEHTVDIEAVEIVPPNEPSGDDKPEHPGYLVTLRETPALFDTDTEFQFHADHESKFPLQTVRRCLDGSVEAADESDEQDGPETLWSPRVLTAVSTIAKRRKSMMRFFRAPGQRVQRVQIGGAWLGAVMAGKALPGESLSEPSIDPLLTRSAVDDLADTLKDMAANGITVTVENPRGAVAQTLADAVNAQSD